MVVDQNLKESEAHPQDAGAPSNVATGVGYTSDADRPSGKALKGEQDLTSLLPSRPSSPNTLSDISVEDHLPTRAPKAGLSTTSSSWRTKNRAFWVKNLGLFYMVVAQFFGTAMNVTTRFLEVQGNHGKGLHPFQVLFARMTITVIMASTYMWYTKTPHFPFGAKEVRWLLVARGIGGFFGVFGLYYSLTALPIADATVITYLAPGLSCWACSILIKEPFTHVEKIGTFVSLFGVIFIARPTSLLGAFSGGDTDASETSVLGTPDVAVPSNSTVPGHHSSGDFHEVSPDQRIAAVGMALVGVLGACAAFTTIRWIGKRAHPLISVNYFAVWCAIVSTVAQLTIPGIGFLFPADLKEWAMLLFLGWCGFIMQFLLAAGLSYEKSSRVTNMTYISMLYALASDKIFFGTSPGASSIIGSTLILGAAIVMALQKAQPVQENIIDGPELQADEERGLMGNADLDEGEDSMSAQEMELRSLR